ncbi:MAG: hypothetical protein ABWY26_12855 [Microbacterium sp.]
MTPRIGWYIHHHGRGHLTRMLAIAPHLDAEIRCFSSLPQPEGLPEHCSWILLDRDDDLRGAADPRTADPEAGGLLHWAPLGHAGHLGRLATMVASVAHEPVDAFVVDVSVEVALLARVLGIRTVVIAQPGRRNDAAHELGYRSATTIVAPWPGALLRPPHLAKVKEKTVFTGGISRFDGRERAPRSEHPAADGNVVLLGSRGGSAVSGSAIAAAMASSGSRWRVLGATPDGGWTADPWDELASAGVVVGWAGQNSIADIAAADASAVIVPQERPFAEQLETALAVDRAGLAVVATAWPPAEAWPELIERAAHLQPDWSRWEVRGAAARAAAAIDATARGRQ